MDSDESVDDRLNRVADKVRSKQDLKLGPCLAESEVSQFESLHGISLPVEYRNFLLKIGNGASGPPSYGLKPLIESPRYRTLEAQKIDQSLPFVRSSFPFTKSWIWEDGDLSEEGTKEQISFGNLCLGTDGCGQDWVLIIAGKDRGIIWMICDVGIQPTNPKRDFLIGLKRG